MAAGEYFTHFNGTLPTGGRMLILLARIIAGIVGLMLLYAAFFLHETEEREVQSRIEDWWIAIDDVGKDLHARHVAFMRGIARVTTAGLDGLFGKRILSLRAISSSALGSLAIFGLFGWSFGMFAHPSSLVQECIDVGIAYFVLLAWMLLLQGLWMLRRFSTALRVIAILVAALATYFMWRVEVNAFNDILWYDINI
jgi:hypothetical protein